MSEKFIPMTKTQLVVGIKVALVVSEARTLIGPILIHLENLKSRFKLELNQNQKSIQFLNLRKSDRVYILDGSEVNSILN